MNVRKSIRTQIEEGIADRGVTATVDQVTAMVIEVAGMAEPSSEAITIVVEEFCEA